MKNFKQINNKIQEASIQLKTEFFGIDAQIDSIIENITPWICFPEILTRPTIINLWGMTGCGKTSLINRLIELLDIKEKSVYFNFAQLDEKSSWEVEDMLEGHVSDMNIDTPIFIYDEFQYAKTIDEDGKELSKAALKIFWELLDSGKYQCNHSYTTKLRLKTLIATFTRVIVDPNIVIEKGVIIEGEKHYKRIAKVKNTTSTSWDYIDDEEGKDEIATLFSTEEKAIFFKILNQHYPHKYVYIEDIYAELLTMNKEELYTYIQKVYKLALSNITFDFSKSLIFVLGNLDEAYSMVYDSNPDMSADQFHDMSKQISIVGIKNALKHRFRIEQIARLGNIHLIYPSFSSQTFKDIITKDIDAYSQQILVLTNKNLIVDNSIHDIIYNDAVFPTHGARPIFTSIHEIVKTKLSTALTYAATLELDYDTLYYTYENDMFVIIFKQSDVMVNKLIVKQTLRVEDLRVSKTDDKQASVAVHEAGHAVVSIALTKKVPTKIRSTSSDETIGGFILEGMDTVRIANREYIKKEISIYLAGKCAEEYIFNDAMLVTNGCSEDFSRATSLAVHHIRRCGFGNHLANSGWMQNFAGMEDKIFDHTNDIEIEKLLRECQAETKNILIEQRALLLRLSDYLSKNGSMEKSLIQEFVDKYYSGSFEEKSDHIYKDILAKQLASLPV